MLGLFQTILDIFMSKDNDIAVVVSIEVSVDRQVET